MSDVFGDVQELLAVDLSAKLAVQAIEEMESPAALSAFMAGEGRVTVMRAAEAKFPGVNAEADMSHMAMEATPEQIQEQEEFEPDVDEDLSGRDKGPEGKRDASGEKWYEIEIDEVEGRPNFEVVGVNGTIYRIQRGVPTAVPESVLGVLNTAVAERVVQTDKGNAVETTRRKYSSVPFRMLRAL
jgi:hypothetical protein